MDWGEYKVIVYNDCGFGDEGLRLAVKVKALAVSYQNYRRDVLKSNTTHEMQVKAHGRVLKSIANLEYFFEQFFGDVCVERDRKNIDEYTIIVMCNTLYNMYVMSLDLNKLVNGVCDILIVGKFYMVSSSGYDEAIKMSLESK